MPNVSNTIRKVKNKSGLDLTVPSYSDKSELFKNVLHCNVVAVSRLACYKQSHHKDSDIVQFTVTKKFEDFEEFRRRISASHPGTIFPPLPKSLFSFVEGSVKEQVALIEDFLQFVAVTPKTASCADTLMFLGFSSVHAGRTEMGRRSTAGSSLFAEQEESADSANNLFTADADEEEDLFAASPEVTKTPTSPNVRLFEDLDYGGEVLKTDELVQIAGVTDKEEGTKGSLFEADKDEEDLLRVEDDLDKLLIGKKSKTPTVPESKSFAKVKPTVPSGKPKITPKPSTKPSLAPKPGKTHPGKSTLEQKAKDITDSAGGNDSGIDTGDILKYIQDNTKQEEEDIDLFS